MDSNSNQKESELKEPQKPKKDTGSFLSTFKLNEKAPKTKETVIEKKVRKTNPLMQAKEALFKKLSKTSNIILPLIEKDSLPPVQENFVEEDINTSTVSKDSAQQKAEVKPEPKKVPELEKKEKKVFNVPRQQVNPIMKHKKTLMRPLRTYKDDILEAIRNKKASLVSIAAAEQKERAKKAPLAPESPSHKTRNSIALIGLSAGLIIVGISSIIFFTIVSKTDVVEKNLGITALVFSESNSEFDMTNITSKNLVSRLHKESLNTNITLNTFKYIYITKDSLIGKSLVSASDFFKALGTSAPDPLLRSLDSEFMFGIHAFDGNQPFFIFKTRSFDTSFASMLDWETRMNADLNPLFGPLVTRSLISTRKNAQLSLTNNASFVDLIIKSRDVRVLFNERGDIVLLYAFLDKKTIVITTNEHTFEEIFTRIASTRISR